MQLKKVVLSLIKGTAVAQVVSLILLPVVTKIYDKESLGVYFLIVNCTAMFLPMVSLRLEQVLLVCKDDEREWIAFLGALLTIPIGVAFSLIYYVISDFGEEYSAPFLLLVMSIILWLSGVAQVLRYYLLSLGELKKVNFLLISKTVLKYVLILIFGWFAASSGSLIFAELASLAIVCIVFARVVWGFGSFKAILKKLAFHRALDAINKNYNYTCYDFFATTINTALVAVSLPLLSNIYGMEVVAYYSLAVMLVSIPNYHLGKAIGDSFQLFLGKKGHIGSEELDKYNRVVAKLFGVSVLVYAAGGMLAPHIVSIVFGEGWQLTSEIIQILCFQMAASLISSPASRGLVVIGKSHIKLIVDLLALFGVLFVAFVSESRQLYFLDFVVAVSVVRIAGYVVVTIYMWSALKRRACESFNGA